MTRRVLKWPVPVDDADHPIGTGPVVLVDACGHRATVWVWTEEPQGEVNAVRRARVYGTGQLFPEGDVHVGSTVAGSPFVWHVYAAAQAAEDPR